MSTNACQKHTDPHKSVKKSAKRHHAIKKRKQARRRNKQRSKNRGQQVEARRFSGPRHLPNYHSVIQSSSCAMASESRDPAASFWGNYNVAMEWQSKHFVNYWKSRCSALELENHHLYKTIESLTDAKIPDQSSSNTNDKERFSFDPPEGQEEEQFYDNVEHDEHHGAGNNELAEEDEEYEDCQDEESYTFVIDEDMIKFLETSAKHKLEMKKKKDAELEASEDLIKATEKLKLPREIMAERRQEMSKLYGSESSPMILGMETAMQLTFDRFVSKHQPKHWPNIPLNL